MADAGNVRPSHLSECVPRVGKPWSRWVRVRVRVGSANTTKKTRYSITSRTAMTPPSLLRDDPWAESHDLCCFGKLGSKAEGGYPSQTVGSVIGGATEMSFK